MPRIVLFGATGFTGGLTRALVAGDVTPVLAAGRAGHLATPAAGLEARVA
jgi:short subunit dehydrogenase-like uncharacterized protein